MAIACFVFCPGPALPSVPLLSSPCAYSCMTRPRVLRWLGVGLEEDVELDGVMGMGASCDAPLSRLQRELRAKVPSALGAPIDGAGREWQVRANLNGGSDGAAAESDLRVWLEGAGLRACRRGRQDLRVEGRARAQGHARRLHLQPLPLCARHHRPPGGDSA